MKAKDIFVKTLPFVWIKLGLWLITLAASAVWFIILALITAAAKNGGVAVVALGLWIGGTSFVNFILNRYVGYLVKAGHVAVITEAVLTGQIPDNQVEYGKRLVTERFVTANVYFMVDNLVRGAVKQIQRVVGTVGGFLSFIPGMKQITNIAKFFVEISLGYIDECCLGYTFYKKDQGAFKSAADGVVIYAQNWKTLLANAAKTMVKVLIVMAVVVVAFAIIFSNIFNLISPNNWMFGIAAIVFAMFLAYAIKYAFMDSFILVQMMTAYMQVAPETVITFNLYDKLCGLSKKFRDLFNKAKEESPISPEPAFAGATAGADTGGGGAGIFGGAGSFASTGTINGAGAPSAGASAQAKSAFCTNCGSKIAPGKKFCGNCGKPV